MKSFFLAFIGGLLGTLVGGAIVFFIAAGYVESKLAIINTAATTVESVIEQAPGALENITNNDFIKKFTHGN